MADGGRLAIGLSLPTWPLRGGGHASWPDLRRLALAAEAMGIDTLWVPDHLQRVVPGRPPFGFWECWTILTAAAEATSRIEIGPFVACTGFRNPALLAKMAVTLDEVSGGRLVLGLGSGVPATDASWLAFGFDGARHVSKHAEAVEVVARLLREPSVTFEGEHYHTRAAQVLPRGPRDAGPPIWVAAKGDRTLAIAARWGDAVNVNVPLTGAADAERIAGRVAAACATIGRDPATLALTGWARLAIGADGAAVARPGWLAGAPDDAAATMRAMHAAGLRHLTLYVGEEDDPSPLPALNPRTLDALAPFLDALRAAPSVAGPHRAAVPAP
jgi:alkanesulfonate monooxygenase SsuD/methylene tetrahydromethanopterin reductase-like flavin-dependent oxidoreductase (luciferase family)